MNDCPPEEPRGLDHQILMVDYLRNAAGYGSNQTGLLRLVPIEVPPASNVISLAEQRAKRTREQRPPGW
jgi:hypothetical protein